MVDDKHKRSLALDGEACDGGGAMEVYVEDKEEVFQAQECTADQMRKKQKQVDQLEPAPRCAM